MEAVRVEFTVRREDTVAVEALSVDVKIDEPVKVEYASCITFIVDPFAVQKLSIKTVVILETLTAFKI